MQTYDMIVPDVVTIVNQDGEPIRIVEQDAQGKVTSDTVDKPWIVYRFLCIFVLVREEWRKPFARAVLAHEVAALFKDAQPGDTVTLLAGQWQALRDTLTSDTFELPQHYSYQLAPLGAAILAAVPNKLESVPVVRESPRG